MRRTEFFETAVKRGHYGVDKSGLFGKKDNVRRYWEDVSIKMALQPAIEQILQGKEKIRIVDLGCGSGEGVELLTHIPPSLPVKTTTRDFAMTQNDIDIYQGIDISPAMVEQGKHNYATVPQIQFAQADLSDGFPFMHNDPYDIYFSSYSSQSHLTYAELEHLTRQIFSHIDRRGYMVFDLFGRYSCEWPTYWGRNCHPLLPYTMAYLLPPQEQIPQKITWYDVVYWSGDELIELIDSAASASGRQARILSIKDRSVLVGRHMDTTLFKKQPHQVRMAVNRLFDRDYRGDISGLRLTLDYLDEAKEVNRNAWDRIAEYYRQWSVVIDTLDALMASDNGKVKNLIESNEDKLADELKMLAWLYRNADRFPVVDFWASVMGPQIACVLRNLEFSLPQGVGCGHGLSCVVEITKS